MEEETVTCANCGREVPRTLYCIYCGSALFKKESEPGKPTPFPKKSVEPKREPIETEPVLKRVTEPKMVQPTPPLKPQAMPKPVEEFEIDHDISELMENLKNNYIWKVRLCGVLCDNGVSEEVFTGLFEEYVNKINQLSQVRNEKVAYYLEDFKENKAELEEAKRKHEELKVRAAIGQISSTEVEAQSPELEKKIDSQTQETSRLEAQLARLNDLMRDTSPKDIFDLEKTTRRCLDSLDLMLTNGKISNKLGNDLRKDLEAATNVFDNIIGDKKHREKDLRDQLSTQEARYKVGEITISEFEAQKRRINAELEQIWA